MILWFCVLTSQSVHSETNDSLRLAHSLPPTPALYPTFGNHRIYQLQHAETESAQNVVRLLSAETKCPPKVPICPHSAPKPQPKPKFGQPLLFMWTAWVARWCSGSTWLKDQYLCINIKHKTIFVLESLWFSMNAFGEIKIKRKYNENTVIMQEIYGMVKTKLNAKESFKV